MKEYRFCCLLYIFIKYNVFASHSNDYCLNLNNLEEFLLLVYPENYLERLDKNGFCSLGDEPPYEERGVGYRAEDKITRVKEKFKENFKHPKMVEYVETAHLRPTKCQGKPTDRYLLSAI